MPGWIYKFLIKTNFWVALAVAALCYLSLEPYSILPYHFLAFVFFATVSAYSYMRLVQYSGVHQDGFRAWQKIFSRPVLWHWLYTLLAGLVSLYFLREIYRPGLAGVLFLPVLISVLYPITFPRADTGFTSLRLLPGLKLFLIAFTWAYMTVLVPEALYGNMNVYALLEFVFRIILIASLVIPFDIRDLQEDDPSMHTLPQVIGYRKARELAFFGIFLYQLWLAIRVFAFDFDARSTLALILAFELGAWLIRKAHPGRDESYFSFWIESIPIMAVLTLIVESWLP